MKYLFSIVPLLFLLSSRSCDKKVQDTPSVMLGETLEIAYGQKTMIDSEGLGITYAGINDSRCPADVQCIRAGEAKIELLLEKNGQSDKIMLEAKGLCMDRDGKCGNSNGAMGYMFQLLTADPYPEEGKSTAKEKTSIRIIVHQGKTK